MWQKTQMVTDQKSIFLQFSCIENIISVLKDSVWLIDVLIERRKSLGNFSHTPGDGSSWHLGILVFPGLFYFVPKLNEHKAKPWSTFYDFSWPKLIIFSIVEKVGKYPLYCPRNHKKQWALGFGAKETTPGQISVGTLKLSLSVEIRISEKKGWISTSNNFRKTAHSPDSCLAAGSFFIRSSLWWWTDINSSWFSRENRNSSH